IALLEDKQKLSLGVFRLPLEQNIIKWKNFGVISVGGRYFLVGIGKLGFKGSLRRTTLHEHLHYNSLVFLQIYKTSQPLSLVRKRAAAFQSLLAPPQGTTGHGTGGDGTAVESPIFLDRSPIADDVCWPETGKKTGTHRNFKASDLPPPATISLTQASGTRQARGEIVRRSSELGPGAVACTRHPPPGHRDFASSGSKVLVRNQLRNP
ncbi:GTP1/OBG family protein, partial [Prunus dulcis]